MGAGKSAGLALWPCAGCEMSHPLPGPRRWSGHAVGRAMQVVGWSQEGQCVPECCRVQLPPIISLWSFPFGGFDKAVKDFNVEHDVDDSFLRCSEVVLHKWQNDGQSPDFLLGHHFHSGYSSWSSRSLHFCNVVQFVLELAEPLVPNAHIAAIPRALDCSLSEHLMWQRQMLLWGHFYCRSKILALCSYRNFLAQQWCTISAHNDSVPLLLFIIIIYYYYYWWWCLLMHHRLASNYSAMSYPGLAR